MFKWTLLQVYRDNLDFAIAVILSGNHFRNIAVLPRTSYYSYQCLYICPAIDQYFTEQQVKLSVVLCYEIL